MPPTRLQFLVVKALQWSGLLPPTVALSGASGTGGWYPIVREPYAGAWQQNVELNAQSVLSFAAVYACVTLIASDIGKMRPKLVEQDEDGIWHETTSTAFSPVLRKPNRYQTRITFLENWITSKLIHGNTYILKERDARGVVVALYPLDPLRVRPLILPDGAVWYELSVDNLAGRTIEDPPAIPASEIIHDVCVPLYHPLCGVSPISACGLAAIQGLKIQENSAFFFANGGQPGGVLTSPGFIKDETARRMKADYQTNFTGQNAGALLVLGDGLKYDPLKPLSAVDAQLIEQLRWGAETVCTAFHVPAYMIGVGPAPTYNNVEALAQQYYAQCLQTHIESIELLLDEGLGLTTVPGHVYGTELDLDDLLRMDTPARVKAAADGIGSGALAPNEARERYFGLGPVTGGASPYLQQQNYSLAALDARDQENPLAAPPPSPPPPAPDETAALERALLLKAALRRVKSHAA